VSKPTRASRLALAIALPGLALAGCAGAGIGAEELPGAPIAFVHFDAAATRLRTEQAERELKRRTGATTAVAKRGVAKLDDFASFLQSTYGVQTADEKRMQGRMALLDPRTGEVTVVENARRGAVPQDWSSDRTRLMFSQVVHDELPQLFEFDLPSGETRRLTYGQMAHPEGCYGPDGSVVFTAVDVRTGQPQASIMWTDTAGKEAELLSPPGYNYYPTCAPDGSAVAFTNISTGSDTQRVYVRSPIRTGQPRMLSRGTEPAFSADGEWIVFSAEIQGQSTLWRIRPDGTGRGSLGGSALDERRPGLSPDNRLVVYVADTTFHREIYIRRADGTGNRILHGDTDGDRPVW
jgi:TolB protein